MRTNTNACRFPRLRFILKVVSPFLAIAAALSLCSPTWASERADDDPKPTQKESEPVKVTIENFGKVTEQLYRGAQPREDEYSELARLGVKTVIDLRGDPKDYSKESASRAGLHYINFPMSDRKYPSADMADKFLALISDATNLPVFVHCAGGRHRTGVVTAVYRMTVEGWDIDRAYREMKQYDFYTRWGHQEMKHFVFDYFEALKARRALELTGGHPSKASEPKIDNRLQ